MEEISVRETIRGCYDKIDNVGTGLYGGLMNKRWSVLEDYPSLANWLQTAAKKILNQEQPGDRFILGVAQILRSENDQRLTVWFSETSRLLDNSEDVCADLVRSEQLLAELSFDLMAFVSELGELAVTSGRGKDFYKRISFLADQSEFAAFRFLSAWTALNTGDLQGAVDECEKVEIPVACIFTLQGQALLELGEVKDAIACLESATKLSPGEALAFFQLTKAYHATGQHQAAWSALQSCEQLVGRNIEVATFFAMIALESPTEAWLSSSWSRLIPYLIKEDASLDLIIMLMDLAFTANKSEWFSQIVDRIDWSQLRTNETFFSKVPWVLTKLNGLKWSNENLVFLENMTQSAEK